MTQTHKKVQLRLDSEISEKLDVCMKTDNFGNRNDYIKYLIRERHKKISGGTINVVN